MKIQSISDVITNSSSEIFVVRDKAHHTSGEEIAEAIRQHAKECRNPYADWWIEKNKGKDPRLDFYNSTNGDPDGYLETLTLLDMFFLYVMKTRELGYTPQIINRRGASWSQVTVDDMLEAFKDEEKLGVPMMDHYSLFVNIDHDLDKTTDAIRAKYDTIECDYLPTWVDILMKSLYFENMKREGDEYQKIRDIYNHCQDAYKKWLDKKCIGKKK